MKKVAPMTVGTGDAGEDHPADFGLVPGVADDRTELPDAVSELAVHSVWAVARLLPFVAQLCLESALSVHLYFKWLMVVVLSSTHVHLLLC